MSVAAAQQTTADRGTSEATGAIARNAFWLVLGQVWTTFLAVLLASILGRGLGPVDFGVFSFMTRIATFAFVLVEWGQGPYVIREVARHPDRAGGLLGTGLALRVAGAVLVGAVVGAALLLFRYDARTIWLCALLIAMTLPFSLSQGYGMVFRGRERMELDAIVSSVNKLLVVVLTVGALVLLRAGVVGAALAQGLGGIGALVLAALLLRGQVKGPPLQATVAGARELVVGGAPLVLMTIAAAAQNPIDSVVLTKLAPAECMGWYGAAQNIFGTLGAAAFILGTAAFPRLARAARDPAAFRTELTAAMRPLLGLAALSGVGCWLFADFAVGVVFGKARFAPAVPIIQAYAVGQVLLYVDVLLATAIIAAGRSVQLAIAKAVSLVLVVVLDVALVTVLQARTGNGGIGVVLAFTVCELVMSACAFWILPRGSVQLTLLLDAGRALLASAGTLAVFWALPHLPPLIGLPLCIVVFVALAVAVGLVRRGELEAVRRLVRRPREA